jgi:hypothetical protein
MSKTNALFIFLKFVKPAPIKDSKYNRMPGSG